MTKIYTRRGDSGETDLMGGMRVPKDDLRIAALGEVDELNAAIGLAMAVIEDRDITATLHRLQNDLFTVGADLSVAPGKELKLPKVTAEHVEILERDIEKLSPVAANEFVLPGGSMQIACLQLARAIARRAERAAVALSRHQELNRHVLEYLNRVSTLLYVLALSIKKSTGMTEEHPRYD
jgi:cob(I)alamin adenosyltransferase